MPTRNVHLTEHFDSFIAASIETGRFSNASEAVRAALRLLEQQEQEDEAKLVWLRGATQEAFAALDRGEGVQLGAAEDIDRFRGWHHRRGESRSRPYPCLADRHRFICRRSGTIFETS